MPGCLCKKNSSFLGEIHYETIEKYLWQIKKLTDVWSIGKKTAKKLNKMGIYSLMDLAHFDPEILQKKLGVIGAQLYALSWGIDRSILNQYQPPKAKSIGNSQVLPYDYNQLSEIRIVFRELADQVATRIRKQGYFTKCISIHFNNSNNNNRGISRQMQIEPTNTSLILANEVEKLITNTWNGEPIRQIAVYCTELITATESQTNLFLTNPPIEQENNLETTVDQIRQEFGFSKLVRTASLKSGGTAIKRAGLVGGHAGGNAYE